MNKTGKIIISFLLLFAIVTLLSSCDLIAPVLSKIGLYDKFGGKVEYDESFPFPEGYTGGVESNYQFHLEYEIKWIETYEEMIDAVTHLRAHGNDVDPIALFDCEEYGYDLKFCVIFSRNKSEALSEGQNYFDRKLANLTINTYVFFEDVSIDELIYNQVSDYKHVKVGYIKNIHSMLKNPHSNIELSIKKGEIANANDRIKYYVAYNDIDQFYFTATYMFELTDEQIEVLEKTLTVIE